MIRYSSTVKLGGVIATLEKENRYISQRDMYYSLKFLFKSQNDCNRLILQIGKVLNLKRHEMRIIPSSRGYVAGNLKFRVKNVDDNWTNCMASDIHGGTSISNIWTSVSYEKIEIETGARYLIIIEKEGVFRRFCEDGFCKDLPCIIVTGCGYPDVATRALVHVISIKFPYLIIFGICDYNPHGLSLLLTYKLGSMNTNFEAEGFKAERLKWLGLRTDQISSLNLDNSCFETMKDTDIQKIKWLLDRTDISDEYKLEITKMQEFNRKCELEALYSLEVGYISNYFKYLILNRNYI